MKNCVGQRLYRVHDLSKPGDHGAKDKSLVYVEFQGGLFEAMKHNMMSVLKENHSIVKTSSPQVETYGKREAEERYCLNMCIKVGEHSHAWKHKIYIMYIGCTRTGWRISY